MSRHSFFASTAMAACAVVSAPVLAEDLADAPGDGIVVTAARTALPSNALPLTVEGVAR